MKTGKFNLAVLLCGVVLFWHFFGNQSFLGLENTASQLQAPPAVPQENLDRRDQGLVFKNLELKNLKWFPQESVLRIQELVLNVSALRWDGIYLEIKNARISLPHSEPVVITALVKEGNMSANVFATAVDVEDALRFFPRNFAKGSTGTISGVDVSFDGTWQELRATGKFHVEDFSRHGFEAKGCPGQLALKLDRRTEPPRLEGEIVIDSGTLKGPKTATVQLQKGRLGYTGDMKNPSLNVTGQARVEDVKIDATLQGTLRQPDLRLESDPPMTQDRLLVMLATGKSWASANTLTAQGGIPTDLVRDFIDYFALSGNGDLLAERFGISDLKMSFDKNHKGIGLKKTITGNLKASYELEQKQDIQGTPPETIHRVGGEVQINDNLSLEAQKGLKPETPEQKALPTEPYKDEKITIQFKKKF